MNGCSSNTNTGELERTFCYVKTDVGVSRCSGGFFTPSVGLLPSVGRLPTAHSVDHLGHVHLVGLSSPPALHSPPSARRAAENFPEAFPEVFGYQGVDDGVEAGVGISHEVGQDAQDIGGTVEREVSRPHAHDDQVVGEPAEAEDGGDDDDHLGDFPLSSPELGHVIDGVHAGPQVSKGAGVGEAEHQDGDQVTKDEGAHVHDNARLGTPGGNTHHSGSQVQLAVVAKVWSGKN